MRQERHLTAPCQREARDSPELSLPVSQRDRNGKQQNTDFSTEETVQESSETQSAQKKNQGKFQKAEA